MQVQTKRDVIVGAMIRAAAELKGDFLVEAHNRGEWHVVGRERTQEDAERERDRLFRKAEGRVSMRVSF